MHWYTTVEISGLEVPWRYLCIPVKVRYFQSCFLSGSSRSIERRGPTTGVSWWFIIHRSMSSAAMMHWIRNSWVIEKPFPSAVLLISTPKYLLRSPLSMKTKFSCPFSSDLINVWMTSKLWLRRMKSLMQTSTMRSLLKNTQGSATDFFNLQSFSNYLSMSYQLAVAWFNPYKDFCRCST